MTELTKLILTTCTNVLEIEKKVDSLELGTEYKIEISMKKEHINKREFYIKYKQRLKNIAQKIITNTCKRYLIKKHARRRLSFLHLIERAEYNRVVYGPRGFLLPTLHVTDGGPYETAELYWKERLKRKVLAGWIVSTAEKVKTSFSTIQTDPGTDFSPSPP